MSGQGTPLRHLVVLGLSNILSDIFDCALALGLPVSKVVRHLEEEIGPRDLASSERVARLSKFALTPELVDFAHFTPQADELYILGPTTPTRAALVAELEQRFGLAFTTLAHPTAYVSPLAEIGQGVFIGANSVIGPGAVLERHVFINRGATVGHDTRIGEFSRVQPGANLGGLSRIGRGVTVGLGATVLERLVVGEGAFIGAGAVVLEDVPPHVLVVGVPARVKKTLA